jgi:hypothetical protein
MDWEQFLIGVGMIIGAILLRRLDVWTYGKDGQEADDYSFYKKVGDKIYSVLLIIAGVIVVLVSFAG